MRRLHLVRIRQNVKSIIICNCGELTAETVRAYIIRPPAVWMGVEWVIEMRRWPHYRGEVA